MKRSLTALFALLAIVGMLAACGGQPTASQAPASGAAGTKTAIIGFTASITGKSNVESTRQKNGLQLWMDRVKATGGVALADGGKVIFDAKSYDDESNSDRVQELYARLVNEDKADFLISPYGSGPADAAAVLAEQYGKIMITAGAASDSTYKKGYTLVYQTYTPASRYLTGALDALAKLDPNAKKLAIVHENDKFSTDVVKALKTYAEGKSYQIVVFEGYDTSTTDFGPIINKVQQAQPDAILGGGHFQDGNTFAKQLAEKRIDVKFLALLVAPPEPKFAELGAAALGVVGPSQWEPLATFTPEAAKSAGLEWYGPTGAEFVSAYKAAYQGEEPSYHAAGGYMAGLILQRAIEQAKSLDTKAVKDALDKLDLLTFFGHIKFNTSDAHGLQVGHDMVYIQWQKDASDKLAKQVIWPAEGATARALYPAH
jgi:ABC-type branched-subunit amino acid transport system substrate-binding protein